MRAIIISSDPDREDFLRELLRVYDREGILRFETRSDTSSLTDAGDPALVQCVYLVTQPLPSDLSVNDVARMCDNVAMLSALFPRARILVELCHDAPADAFEAVRNGAFNVTDPGMLAEDIWKVLSYAVGDDFPYPPLLNVERPRPNWGFMSMAFRPQDPAHVDYAWAIKPVMKRLGLDLKRIDEIPYRGPRDLRERMHEEIANRDVLVAQITSLTPDTMYEIGFASAMEKDILWLRRNAWNEEHEEEGSTASRDRAERPWRSIPSVLSAMVRLQYSTRTELAMKLFFGLGGTRDDLIERSE